MYQVEKGLAALRLRSTMSLRARQGFQAQGSGSQSPWPLASSRSLACTHVQANCIRSAHLASLRGDAWSAARPSKGLTPTSALFVVPLKGSTGGDTHDIYSLRTGTYSCCVLDRPQRGLGGLSICGS